MYSLPGSKRTALFFFFLNSRGPRNKARISPEKLDVHTAKSGPAGSQLKEKQNFPQSHHYREDFYHERRKD